MSGTSGDRWLEELRIKPDDFDAFHVKLRVHFRDVWETYFQGNWREFPDGVPAKAFYSKLKDVNAEPFHRYCFDEILKYHPREFAREINNNRLERSDRRIFLKLAAAGVAAFFGAKYAGRLFPNYSLPSPPELSEAEKERMEQERTASLYASFIACQPQEKRIAVTDSIERLSNYTDTLENRLYDLKPEMMRDKRKCFNTAELICQYRAAVGEELDFVMKTINFRQTKNGYIVTYKQPSNLIMVAGIAAKLQKLPPRNAEDIKTIIQDYSDRVSLVRDEYEKVKHLLREEHIPYEDIKKFGKLGTGIWGLVRKYEDFRREIDAALNPAPIARAYR